MNVKKTKVTQSYIAAQLDLSRNTVSKVLNNIGGVPEKTRQLVLDKAAELGYRHVSSVALKTTLAAQPSAQRPIDIAFMCHKNSVSGSFFTTIIHGIQEKLSESNARLRIIMLSDNNFKNVTLPNSILHETPHAIITAGTFSKEYYLALRSLNCTMVSLDSHPQLLFDQMIFDTVLVDNIGGAYAMTQHLIEKGHKKLCFAGNIASCLSFYERWQGFKQCMQDHGLSFDVKEQLTALPSASYFNCDEMKKQIHSFKKIPTAFVCVNDDTAKTFAALQNSPHNFLSNEADITGFDNIVEYTHFLRKCSSIEIYPHDIGLSIAEQVLWRIAHPDRQYITTRLAVTPIFR